MPANFEGTRGTVIIQVKGAGNFLPIYSDNLEIMNCAAVAIANSITATDAGATYLDGACRCRGAGAGNAQIEVLLGCLKHKGYETSVDFF